MIRTTHTLRVLHTTFTKTCTRKAWVIIERHGLETDTELVALADYAEVLAHKRGCTVATFQGRRKVGETSAL